MRLSLFAKGSPLRESCRRRRLRGFVPEATLSVTASPCHLSRKGEALAKARSLWVYRLASSAVGRCGRNLLVLPRARPSGELSSAARLRGFVPKATLSVTASPCHLSRKGEALAKARSLWVYQLTSSAVDRCGRNLLVLPRPPPSGEVAAPIGADGRGSSRHPPPPQRNPYRHALPSVQGGIFMLQ